MKSIQSRRKMLRDVRVVGDVSPDKSKSLPCIDSNATITEKTRTFTKVDLFCPHPFLLAQQTKSTQKSKPVQDFFTASPDELLSTTAFPRATIRSPPRPAPQLRVTTVPAPPREFATQIRRLLDLIQDMRPEELAPLVMQFVPVLMEVRRNMSHLRLNGRHMVVLGILARIVISNVPQTIRERPTFSQDGLRELIHCIENIRLASPALSTPTMTSPASSSTDTSSIATPANSPALPNNPETSSNSQLLNPPSGFADNPDPALGRRTWRHSISQRFRIPYMR
ncbi:hypothetical protein FRC12_008908 [Ceratobasidium sp. 428]|nr:hypothetical protein FRC12_008908 [Ceratobasidium sp. 428]